MARVEKLERANANLRTKNKALTHAYAAKSETLDELWGERPVDVTLVARRS
ncbi:hypothetical protein [Acidisoma cladoniae]|jgi:hypothetical protein|uniref:hypothetical protein n=1 Tax=Acidisoma cladoniae TaxID=3040935 RepID=UPI0025513301|nr:hypothetical protein [Acidisoma sp. PAMC 29798]